MRQRWKRFLCGMLAALMLLGSADLSGMLPMQTVNAGKQDEAIANGGGGKFTPVLPDVAVGKDEDEVLQESPVSKKKSFEAILRNHGKHGKQKKTVEGIILKAGSEEGGDASIGEGNTVFTVKFPIKETYYNAEMFSEVPGLGLRDDGAYGSNEVLITAKARCQYKGKKVVEGLANVTYAVVGQSAPASFNFLGGPEPEKCVDIPLTIDGKVVMTSGQIWCTAYRVKYAFVAYPVYSGDDQPAYGEFEWDSRIYEFYPCGEPLPPLGGGGGDDTPPEPIPPAYLEVHKISAHPQFNAYNDNYTLNEVVFQVNSIGETDDLQAASANATVKKVGNKWMADPHLDPVSASLIGRGSNDTETGEAITEEIVVPVGSVEVDETRAPKGFALNTSTECIDAMSDEHYQITFENEPYRSPAQIFLYKDDAEMMDDVEEANRHGISTREPQGDGVFSGAVFHVALYNNKTTFESGMDPILEFDTTSMDIEGKDYGMIDFSQDVITNFRHNKYDGFTLDDYFVDNPDAFSFPLGYVVVTEIKAPVGYTLEDPNLMFMIDHVNAQESITYGPQFAFTVTQEGGTMLGSDGKDPSESLDLQATVLKYVSRAEMDAKKAIVQQEEAEGKMDRTPISCWTIKDRTDTWGTIEVLSVSPICEFENGSVTWDNSTGRPAPTVTGTLGWKVVSTELKVSKAWLDVCGTEKDGAEGLFRATYGPGAEITSLKALTEDEINTLYGSQFDYYIYGKGSVLDSGFLTDYTGIDPNAGNTPICITVNGGIPEVGFETVADFEYRGEEFNGCFYAIDASGNKIYLTYMDEAFMRDQENVPDIMKTWGGIPYTILDVNDDPIKKLEDIYVVQVRTKKSHELQAPSAQKNAELATEPYLIAFNHEFHAYEQVIRGDVQIEKWDYEKMGPEATGASNKSNSTVDRTKDYKGTHLDKVTFAIYNLSNHYVIDPVTHKVILPNELFCTIDTHWNEQLQTYTAETTGGRLPFGTYAVREWSQDTLSTYNLSDTQARIFEIRKNGKLVYNDVDGSQWGLTWVTTKNDQVVDPDPAHWDDTEKWMTYPYDNAKYDHEVTADNYASWVKAQAGKRSGAADSYRTYTKGSPYYEERVVSEGWKINEDTTGAATGKVAADTEIRDNKEKMIFKNFPVRSDFVVKKVRDTYDADEPVSALFILTNTTTGERHLITTDENGEYCSAPVQMGGISFQDHDVNTNALDVLLPKIDELEKTQTELKAWPDTVEIGGVKGDLPAAFFQINPDTGNFTWNMRVVGGLWFSQGENGTYTTYVREFNDVDNSSALPSYVDRVSEELDASYRKPQLADIGHTELTTDASKVVGIPRRAVLQDPVYTQDPGWNIKQAGNILINNFFTTTGRDGEFRLQNTDANTSESSTGHQVVFKRSGIPAFVRTWLGDAGADGLAKLLANGGADHTVLANINGGANNMPNNGRKEGTSKQAVLHIDGYHQDNRKADLKEHVFGALPYGEYELTEVRTTETMNDHLLKFTFRVNSQGEIKDVGTIEDKVVAPKLSTQAFDKATGTQVGVALENWQGYDEVYYEGLDPRSTYTMEASLYDLTAKEPVRYKDGTEVKVQMKFTPEKQSGTVVMNFGEDRPLDMTPYRGHKIIVYEVCYDQWRQPLAEHVDDADEHQMIYFPALDSKADPASATDKKVEDNVFYSQVKGTDGYTYANISSIIKDNGLPLTKTDMKMFEEENILRDGNGQLIPAAEGSMIRHLFTVDTSLPDKEDYHLEVALWDETADTYVYDRYNDDGTLLYDSLNGYGVFSMMGEDGRFFEAYYNPLKQEYMNFEGGTEWIPISGGFPMVKDLASRSVRDDDGYVHDEVVTPLVSKRAVVKKTMRAEELRDTVVTEFTVDTSVLSGHEITSRHILYTTSVDLDFNLVQNHEVGGMFSPAAYQINNIKMRIPVTFEEKETARDGVLAKNTPYKLIAYLLDENGSVLTDRYGNKVTWRYGTAAGGTTYTAKEEGLQFIDVSLLSGFSSIGADKLFGKKLSVQMVAEQGTTKKITVGDFPVSINRYGGTEYKKERHWYEADGTYLAAGTDVPAGGRDFKDNYGAVGAVDDTFWSFYVNPANFDGRPAYESAVAARKGYVYGLEDYMPELDDLHRVTVDDRGTLTNRSYLPFLYDAKGESLLDTVLVTGLKVGEEYTLEVQFFENGELLGTEYDEFMATEKSELRKVSYYPIDASAKAAANHGPYTVKETIKAGKVDMDHDFAALEETTAKTGAKHAEKSVSWLKGLSFKEDEEGAMLTEDFGKAYADLYLLARKIFPQENMDGEFPADFRLDAGVLRRANANPMTYTNILYVIDRMGTWGLADHHASLENQNEKIFFGEEDKKMGTTAIVDGEKYVDKEDHVITITDVIEYEGYDDIRKGTLRTWAILKSTLEKIPGTEKETPVDIDPSGKGTFEVKVDVNLENIPNGSDIVMYEELYDVTGVLVGEHKNPDDEDQTIHVGEEPEKKLGTTASVNGNKYVSPSAGSIVVTDVVKYEGYEGGMEATLKGWLMNQTTGEIVPNSVKEQKAVLDKTGSGSIVMEFEVSTLGYVSGTKFVAFEELYDADGKLVGSHKDITDEGQTVTITDNPDTPDTPTSGGNKPNKPGEKVDTPDTPKSGNNKPGLGTVATVNGQKTVTPGGNITITDTVSFQGYPAGEYTMAGYVVVKKNGNVLVNENGKPISAKTKFKTDGSGSVNMTFTFNSAIFSSGDELVVFENMLDAKGNIVGSHLDLNDASQTITFKNFRKVQTMVDDSAKSAVVDAAAYLKGILR